MIVPRFLICLFGSMVFVSLTACSASMEPAVNSEATFALPVEPTQTPSLPAEPTAEPTVPAAPVVRAIEAGMGNTFALTDAGAVKCWGVGYLCDGSTVNKSAPVDKPELAGGVTAISAGGGHACALTAGGGVKCWGSNNFGQLGNDSRDDSAAPVDVAGLSGGVAAIAAGSGFTCALTAAGGVKCWGDNGFGQLGNGTYDVSRTPVDVGGLSAGVTAIAAGGTHACAVMDSGGVKCWGWNGSGELGNPRTIEQADRYHPFPADVEGLTEAVVEVAAGESNTCARTARGTVKCWGQRGNGLLGDGVAPEGQKEFSSIPVDVAGLPEGITAISVGAGTACALASSGAAFCWGNTTGGDNTGDRSTRFAPVPVFGADGGIAAVSAGMMHNCLLTDAGMVKCWGVNSFGQLGNGTADNSELPVDVLGLV